MPDRLFDKFAELIYLLKERIGCFLVKIFVDFTEEFVVVIETKSWSFSDVVC